MKPNIKMVSLSFTWMISQEDSPWSKWLELEDDLARFLWEKGLEAHRVEIMNGANGQALWILSRKAKSIPEHHNRPAATMGQALDKLQKRFGSK